MRLGAGMLAGVLVCGVAGAAGAQTTSTGKTLANQAGRERAGSAGAERCAGCDTAGAPSQVRRPLRSTSG